MPNAKNKISFMYLLMLLPLIFVMAIIIEMILMILMFFVGSNGINIALAMKTFLMLLNSYGYWLVVVPIWIMIFLPLTLLTSTILLNRIEKVISNKWLRLLSFFLPSLVVLIYNLGTMNRYDDFFTVIIPFGSALIIAYMLLSGKYKKQKDRLQNAEKQEKNIA